MTEKKQTPSNHQAQQFKKPETVSPKIKSPVQKDRQEVRQEKNKALKEKKEKLQKETQDYMYGQSSKFSSVSRHLIFGIIGTIWVITYTDEGMFVPNCYLLFSIIIGLLYLLCDVTHYFWDSLDYENELNQIDIYNSQKQLEVEHEQRMDSINQRSHFYIRLKFVILLFCSVLFIIGLCK